jgi:hypothetical protein
MTKRRVVKSVLLDPQNIATFPEIVTHYCPVWHTSCMPNVVGGGLMKRTPMADQTTRTAPEPVKPESLTAAERAVLFNIETRTDWSDAGVVTGSYQPFRRPLRTHESRARRAG